MRSGAIEQLREISESASKNQSTEERTQALSQAFQLFSEETQNLQTAYKDLQERFMVLNIQLEESDRQLQAKVAELSKWQQIASRNDRLKELGEMAASLAHEIRNPLGGIKGFASLLRRDLADQPSLRQMAEYIVEGSSTIDRLITNTLNYARPLYLEKEPTPLAPFLEEICLLAQADGAIGEKVSVVHVTEEGLAGNFDRQLMRNVLLNLIHNSAQASEKGKVVRVEASVGDGNLLIKVVDQGAGIAPENLEKIFSPFFTTKITGNGLGLAEVHKIIAAHGGWIEFESVVDAGTTATITLPRET